MLLLVDLVVLLVSLVLDGRAKMLLLDPLKRHQALQRATTAAAARKIKRAVRAGRAATTVATAHTAHTAHMAHLAHAGQTVLLL